MHWRDPGRQAAKREIEAPYSTTHRRAWAPKDVLGLVGRLFFVFRLRVTLTTDLAPVLVSVFWRG